MSSCKRCGRCCKEAKICDLKGWVSENHDAKIVGVCDQLIKLEDGTFSCLAIKSAFEKTLPWYEKTRVWITETFIGRGCELDIR